MKNAIYLETSTSPEDYYPRNRIKISLESLITYSVYKFCVSDIQLYFVHNKNTPESGLVEIICENIDFVDLKIVPWQVKSCIYPVAFYDDTIITGLCAVCRHICKFRLSPRTCHEYEEGLLAFRRGCLQAPNEVSIWTKFCEVELINTVKELFNITSLREVPKSLVRFENHLNKPVRIHNIFKVANDLSKDNSKSIEHVDKFQKMKSQKDSRISKQRNWKSNVKEDQTKVKCLGREDLDIHHQYAEGPFFTLADLVLLPSYYIVLKFFGEKLFQSLLPLSHKWLLNVKNVKEVDDLYNFLSTIQIQPLEISQIDFPDVEDVSLYKSDPKRHNPKKRLFTKPDDIEKALNVLVEGMELLMSNLEFEKTFDWDDIPDGANPEAGHLPDERVERKSQQLQNLTLAVLAMAKDGDHIVDFCSGSGHLGILIAHLLPKCTVILLENKEQSLLRARERVHKMGLRNVYFFQCNLDFFIGKFDIGIALHACGIASDLVLDKCLSSKAKFVLCPCCYGSIHATDRLVYPRSAAFKRMSIEQYLCIGHTADQTHKEHPLTVRGARCMAVIDSDRARLAEEHGYTVTLSRLKPLSCTPKNNLLIGVPL
ncbi:glutathione S-transferase C-terminal domain-containing protein homolog [Danaus plexippus]|uniref:glutathione S-transferase C-terminal domain-containing protein homolog n=1 Tax=Danaus plexippus TaxID=13037 RepID=UPI002AAF753E|nr:glutathione S-transferase C-terminal domain-containing protein homolog [Danaus plexippus]